MDIIGMRSVSLDFRLVVQDRIQHRVVHLYRAVVADEPQFAKFVHEMAHARASGPDHFRKRFLADIYADGLRPAVFSKMREKKQKAGKPLFAGIEQLVNEIFLNSNVPR